MNHSPYFLQESDRHAMCGTLAIHVLGVDGKACVFLKAEDLIELYSFIELYYCQVISNAASVCLGTKLNMWPGHTLDLCHYFTAS